MAPVNGKAHVSVPGSMYDASTDATLDDDGRGASLWPSITSLQRQRTGSKGNKSVCHPLTAALKSQ